jgi:septal ring factor EnvC (AmiA/AmiB activator)
MFLKRVWVLILVGVFVMIPVAHAQEISLEEAAKKTTSLQQQIDTNKAKLKELAEKATTLEDKVAQFNLEIDQASKQLEATDISIRELDANIFTTQVELTRQKELLRISLKALYRQGGASEFELLTSSDTFSQYVNDQEYLQRIKDGIQTSATKVIRVKQDLEIQRFTLKELYRKQEAQNKVLVVRRAEQQTLLVQTKGDEATYQKIVEELQRKFEAADTALKLFFETKTFVSLGKVTRGQQIGRVGSSGLSTGPHIHFAVFKGNAYINPVESKETLINGFNWPLPNSKWSDTTQDFGCTDLNLEPRAPQCPEGYIHYGLDIAGWYGDPVVAVADGDIIFNGDQNNGYGNVIIIDHGNNTYTYYPHLLDGTAVNTLPKPAEEPPK